MPDLTAGSKVLALDTPPTVTDEEAGQFTSTSSTYVAAGTGSYADCGTAFVAPTSGRVLLLFRVRMVNSTTGNTFVSPAVRVGATVGSGASFVAADDANSVGIQGTNVMELGSSAPVTGLTPGDTYNVRLEHRVTSGTGTWLRRRVTVVPVS